MYMDFLAGLLLLGFVYALLLAVLALPVALVLTALSRWADARSDYWTSVGQQAFVSVLYAGVIAVSVVLFLDRAPVENEWAYVLTGFVVVFGVLATNARETMNEASGSWNPTDHAIAQGAGLGHMLGLVAYVLFYFVPGLFLAVPGAETLLGWTLGVSQWLIGFGLVQLIVLVLAGLWLLNTGMSLLMWGGMAVAAGVGALSGSSSRDE